MISTMKTFTAISLIILLLINEASCFSSSGWRHSPTPYTQLNAPSTSQLRHQSSWRHNPTTSTHLNALSEEEERELKQVQEESRIKILGDRRKTIRGVLKSAEGTRNFRLNNGYVPELDEETGKPIKSDAQAALGLTAFVVAGGAVLLRIGGRAALVSALGLNFATENPELKDGLDNVLNYAGTIGTESELALFVLAWTAVKVFCFDAVSRNELQILSQEIST